MTAISPIDKLRDILGSERVLTAPEECAFYSQDVFEQGMTAAAVVRPQSREDLARSVAAICNAGWAVVPRGGGMSYTGGYLPTESDSVLLDTGDLNRVLEVNAEDMYVTVEAGCTWKTLHETLAGSGLRPAYWGPLSGIRATVGGSLSQGSIFWGSGRYGASAEAVLGLEVVLADGSLLHTGSAARSGGTPFFRNYGPDLSGLFLGDTGAFGVKAAATLRLVPDLPVRRFASFNFPHYQQLVRGMTEVSRRGLAMECFGFDPYLQAQRLKRESLVRDMKSLAGVVKGAGSWRRALLDGLQVAMAGRRYMRDVKYSLHLTVEERSSAAAAAALAEIRRVCRDSGGHEISNSIPKILRANPFGPVNNMVGPQGERWVPVHGLVPHSKAAAAIAGAQEVFQRHRQAIDAFGIGTGYLFATVGTTCSVIEPVFFWPDELMEIHRRSVEPSFLSRIKELPANEEARAAVTEIRAELITMFQQHGAVHLQIGKVYPYREGLRPESRQLVEGLKNLVDPRRRMNPGALGLQSPAVQPETATLNPTAGSS